MTLRTDLGEALRQAVLEQHDFQYDFAYLVGASEKHVSQVFTGKASCTVATYDQWAKALGKRWQVTLVDA